MKKSILVINELSNHQDVKPFNHRFDKLLIDKLNLQHHVEIFDQFINFHKYGLDKFNIVLEEKIKAFDIVILFQSWFFGFKYDLFTKIKKKFGTKLICIDLESNEMVFIYYLKLLENFDFIFTSDSIFASKIYNYFNIKAEFIPFAFSQDHYFPEKMKNIYDGSFIGQKHTTRPKFIESLKQSGFKIKTFGAYNKNYINWTEMIKIYNQTKINLYFSQQKRRKDKIFDLTMSNNMKSSILHFSMMKNFFLVEFSQEHREILKGYEFLMFRNEKELNSKFKYYLDNQNERDDISEKLYNDIGQKYCFENFSNNFTENILSNFSDKKIIEIDITKPIHLNGVLQNPVQFSHNFFIEGNLSNILKVSSTSKKIEYLIQLIFYLLRTFKFSNLLFLLKFIKYKTLNYFEN